MIFAQRSGRLAAIWAALTAASLSACAPYNHGHVDSNRNLTSNTVSYEAAYQLDAHGRRINPGASVEYKGSSSRHHSYGASTVSYTTTSSALTGNIVAVSEPYTLETVRPATTYIQPTTYVQPATVRYVEPAPIVQYAQPATVYATSYSSPLPANYTESVVTTQSVYDRSYRYIPIAADDADICDLPRY